MVRVKGEERNERKEESERKGKGGIEMLICCASSRVLRPKGKRVISKEDGGDAMCEVRRACCNPLGGL